MFQKTSFKKLYHAQDYRPMKLSTINNGLEILSDGRQYPHSAISQYVKLWHAVDRIQLTTGIEDIVSWRWNLSGIYSARSAYRAFFQGATKFAAAKTIWRAWAPLKIKFFMWLAVKDQLWTVDRRHRRGLQDHTSCAFCEKERETADHIFARCSYTLQVWEEISSFLNIQNHAPT